MFFQKIIKKTKHTHRFHSCSTDLLRASDWAPSAQSASAAGCSRTASGSSCPLGWKKKTFIKQMPYSQKNKKKKDKKKEVRWWLSQMVLLLLLSRISWETHSLTMGQSFKYLRTLAPSIWFLSQWGFSSRPQRSILPGYRCYPFKIPSPTAERQATSPTNLILISWTLDHFIVGH